MSDTDEPKSPKSRRSQKICEIGVILGLVLYVLSWGPAYRMLRKGALKQGTFSAIYCPIIWLRTHNHFIDMEFYKYDGLWYSDFRELNHYIETLKVQSDKNSDSNP